MSSGSGDLVIARVTACPEGGTGTDSFLLADGRGVFYLAGSTRNMGSRDMP